MSIVHRLFDSCQTLGRTSGDLMVESECAVTPNPDLEAIEVIEILHALSDPVRLDIVRQLARCQDELICGHIKISVTKSTASHHFKILFKAGLTSERAKGTCKYISLRRDEMDARFPGLLDSILSAPQAESTINN